LKKEGWGEALEVGRKIGPVAAVLCGRRWLTTGARLIVSYERQRRSRLTPSGGGGRTSPGPRIGRRSAPARPGLARPGVARSAVVDAARSVG